MKKYWVNLFCNFLKYFDKQMEWKKFQLHKAAQA